MRRLGYAEALFQKSIEISNLSKILHCLIGWLIWHFQDIIKCWDVEEMDQLEGYLLSFSLNKHPLLQKNL